MNTRSPWRFLLPILACLSPAAHAAPFILQSAVDPSTAPAAGNGDSFAPIMSGDGRFVLFASTANNLVLLGTNSIPNFTAGRFNVFLRDRASNSTVLVSVDLSGTAGANGDSWPAGISANGRYALFESTASNLSADDTNSFNDIFVRDVESNTTGLASISTNGGAANGASRSSTLSPDGRYVAFVSAANNLVPDDTNGIADVFVRDLLANMTVLVSVGASSTNGTQSSSEAPALTPDGRYVVFYSSATNLVEGVKVAGQVYVRDLVAGTTTWASTNARALAQPVLNSSNIVCYNQAISSNGQYVAFEASVTPPIASSARGVIFRHNLATGTTDLVNTNANVPIAIYEDIRSLDMTPDGRFIVFVANTNGVSGETTCIYLWDALTGLTICASRDLSNLVQANSTCDWPTINPDGRFVAFLSNATNLAPGALTGDYHLYVNDVMFNLISLVDLSTNLDGSGVSPGSVPRLSDDGQQVVFDAPDGSLLAGDRNHDQDVFVHQAPLSNALISARHPLLASTTANGLSSLGALPSASANGRYLAFASMADNLVSGDTNRVSDVFVRDLLSGSTWLVSTGYNGVALGGSSLEPVISADGRFVAFTSSASNIISGDPARFRDVFVYDRQFGTTVLGSVSYSFPPQPGNADSYGPLLSGDGRYLLFRSRARNLTLGAFPSDVENLYFRDLQSNSTVALTTNGVLAATITPDGRYVAFCPGTGLRIWDSKSQSVIFTKTTAALERIAISDNGMKVAYREGTIVRGVQVSSLSVDIANNANPANIGLRFTADGQSVVYSARGSYTNRQVFLYNFLNFTNRLLSQKLGTPGDGDSDSPDVTPDGRFVVYRSFATNLVPVTTSGVPHLFLCELANGTTTLLSANRFDGGSANHRSLKPFFAPDGRTVFFQTWGSDLVPFDFNHDADVLALSFLYLTISPAQVPSQGPTLFWTARPGEAYQAQYKDSLSDASWQPVTGTVTIQGNEAHLTDLAPAAANRFYRVVAF